MAFLFQQYAFAYHIYNLLRKELQAEQQWLPLAAVCVRFVICSLHKRKLFQEMCALSAYIAGQPATGKPYPQHYMDTAINAYMNYASNQPLLAMRATFFNVGILRAQQKYSEAHEVYVRMASSVK